MVSSRITVVCRKAGDEGSMKVWRLITPKFSADLLLLQELGALLHWM